MLRDLLMAQLLALFETFVNDATDSVVKVPERVDEAGTALWEHVCESESRKALLSKLKLPAINIQLQAVIQRFINAPHPDPLLGTLRGRWAQIAMGLLTNFAADGDLAANLVAETVLAIMDGTQSHAGLLTLHAPFTTEYANCINGLLKLNHNTVPEVAAKDSVDIIAECLSANMEEWMQLMMSGNSDLTVAVLRLLHTAAESHTQVHEAALEASVMPALCDFLTAVTQGSIGVHVDSNTTAAACDLLDLFLMSAVPTESAAAEKSLNGARHWRMILNRELAASLAQQLVTVLEQSESTAVSAASTICLYRLACMEDDPVPDVAEHCTSANALGERFHAAASVEISSHHQTSPSHASTSEGKEPKHHEGDQTNVLQPSGSESTSSTHSLWRLAHSGGAVEAIVVAAATLTCDGPAGSYWANVIAVIAVLSWVGAALIKASKQRVWSQADSHTDGDAACKEEEPAKKRAKISDPVTAKRQGPADHQYRIIQQVGTRSQESVSDVQDVSHRFIAKVQRLQEDLMVGLSQDETRAGVQYVLQCSKALSQLVPGKLQHP